ncbi:MAG: FAD-dependent oxidoreductase [Actinomycetota bacterium]|nr:FAD-dependent oxidoreductase [Actinomycetota bacterium]
MSAAPANDQEKSPWVIARPTSPGATELREFLARNGAAYRWLDPDSDPLVDLLGGRRELERRLPLVVPADGALIEPPPQYQEPRDGLDDQGVQRYIETARWRARVAAAFGFATVPARELYDVLIIGAGAAGLTAAVSAASEGLTTLVVERMAPGGQAGTSARIENYPGFPDGISGEALAEGAYAQALRFGAEVLVGVEPLRVTPKYETEPAVIELTSEAAFRARASVLATGVAYRRLGAPGVEELIGAGVHYGSAPAEALRYRGRQVAIVGGANSAGQAALHLADYAERVTLICRSSSLEAGMSRYLVDRVAETRNIDVRVNSEVVRARGSDRLDALDIRDSRTGECTLAADGLFVLIGGRPLTAGVAGWLRRDEHGFLMTGRDLFEDDDRNWWPLERDPYPLEASHPGVFVAGDVRHGSSKRVASAVGEGAMATQLIHRYFADPDPTGRPGELFRIGKRQVTPGGSTTGQ